MKSRSIIRQAFLMLSVLMLLVLAVFAFYCANTYIISRQEAVGMTDNLLKIYCTQIDGELRRVDTMLQDVILDRSDELDLLQNPQERERYFARNEIFNSLRAAFQANPDITMLAVYDQSFDQWIDAHAEQGLRYAQRMQLESFTKELLEREDLSLHWEAAMLDTQAYLYRYYLRDEHIAIAYIKADTMLPQSAAGEEPRLGWLLDRDGVILSQSAPGAPVCAVGDRVEELELKPYVLRQSGAQEGELRLSALLPRSDMLRQLRMGLLVLGLLLLTLVIFSLLLLRYGKTHVLAPLRAITGQLERMKDGQAELYLEGEYGSEEFALLQDSFNHLMTDNVGLRLKNYQTRLETQESELRCIRLQLRPHFFLNALTTISSLSMQGKNEEIRTYISALSRNVRYMFKSGLHTVPLGEELVAVRNYFEMQELKYPGTVFYMLQQEPGTEDWPVPQMVIHTVLENEYKHAVTMGETLTILTGISKITREGEELLCIEIEDDGKGYPAEVLNAPLRQGGDGSRVGLNSIEKMLSIMYGRSDLMELSNVEPHGAKTRLLIPASAVNVYKDSGQ